MAVLLNDVKRVVGRNNNTSANNYVIHLTVEETSTSVADNTSTIKYTVTMTSDNGQYVTDVDGNSKKIIGWAFQGVPITSTLSLAGTQVANSTATYSLQYSGYSGSFPTSITLLSGTTTVAHDSDGKKSMAVALSVSTSTYYDNAPKTGSISKSVDLTTIARASSLTVPASEVMNASQRLTINKSSSSFTHTITYKFGNTTGTIATKTSASYVDYTPSSTLGNQIPSAYSGTITYTIETFNGNTSLGTKTATATLSIPSSGRQPSASISMTLDNSANSVVNGWGIAVKGYSKYRYSVTASGAYGATISSYSVSFAGKTYNQASTTTETIATSGNLVATVTVKDSRGESKTIYSDTITVNNYAAPVISSSYAYRCDSSGTSYDEGSYVKMYVKASCSCDTKNTLTYKWKWREANGSWSAEQTLAQNPYVSANWDTKKNYEVTLIAKDALGSVNAVTYTINAAFVTFNIKDNEKGAAFFGYSTTDGELTIYGNLRVTGTIINS